MLLHFHPTAATLPKDAMETFYAPAYFFPLVYALSAPAPDLDNFIFPDEIFHATLSPLLRKIVI
jgi:hypothetical protein